MRRARKLTAPATTIDRLFAAAETLLRVMRSPMGFEGTVPIFVGPIRHGRPLPDGVFTQAEALDGMDMLVRMGFVQVPAHMKRRRDAFPKFGANPESSVSDHPKPPGLPAAEPKQTDPPRPGSGPQRGQPRFTSPESRSATGSASRPRSTGPGGVGRS